MADQESVTRKPSRSRRDDGQKRGSSTERNGREDAPSSYERELAGYLQERIKPGLNRGAIPLLARSIAKELAHRDAPAGASQEDEADREPRDESDEARGDESQDTADEQRGDEADDESSAAADEGSRSEADDESSAEGRESSDFEDDMRDLQAELGEHWILRFSVHGDEAWLTAEMDDGSQRVEAPTAAVLTEVVELLNEAGGRSG